MVPSAAARTTRRTAASPFAERLAALLLLLLLAAVPTAAGSIHIDLDDGDGDITFEDEDIVIDVDGNEARVTPDGQLYVKGKRVALATREREDFIRYNATLHWVVDRGAELGVEGAGLAFAALGEVLAGLVTGDQERTEHRVKERAASLKEGAREICDELFRLERVQNRLALRVPEFRPYAVMDLDEDDCRVED